MAITFDKVDDTLDCGTIGNFVLKSGVATSFSFWMNATDAGEGSLAQIIGRNGTGSVRLRLNSTAFEFRSSGTTTLVRQTATSFYTAGTWQHFVQTWDGSVTAANVHIYKNTVEASSYVTSTDCVTPTADATRHLFIGNDNATTSTFNGPITEVAIWNKVLSATEIALLYGGGTVLKGTPLAIGFGDSLYGYWPMNEDASGAVNTAAAYVRDKSGLGNHGVVTNGPIYSAEPANLPLPSKPIINKLRPKIFAPGITR